MILSLYEELCAAQESARKAGATDFEVQGLRAEIINSRRKEATGQSYAHEWKPPAQLPPEHDEPEQQQAF